MRRRALLVGLAAVAALVLVTGVVAALEIDSRSSVPAAQERGIEPTQVGAAATVTGELAIGALPLPGPPDAPGLPVPSPPSTTATTALPTTTSTAVSLPTLSSPTHRSMPPPTLSTIPPSVPPTIAVTDAWSSQSDGTTVEVQVSPNQLRAGQAVQFTFEYSSQYPCCDLLVDFGDGSGFQDDAGVTCPEEPPRPPGSRRVTTSHTYAAAGTYLFNVGVVAHARCVFPFPEFHSASVSGALVVT